MLISPRRSGSTLFLPSQKQCLTRVRNRIWRKQLSSFRPIHHRANNVPCLGTCHQRHERGAPVTNQSRAAIRWVTKHGPGRTTTRLWTLTYRVALALRVQVMILDYAPQDGQTTTTSRKGTSIAQVLQILPRCVFKVADAC